MLNERDKKIKTQFYQKWLVAMQQGNKYYYWSIALGMKFSNELVY